MQIKSSVIQLPQSSTAKQRSRVQSIANVKDATASNDQQHKQLQVISKTPQANKFEKIDLRNVMTGDVPGYAKKAIGHYQKAVDTSTVGENLNIKV